MLRKKICLISYGMKKFSYKLPFRAKKNLFYHLSLDFSSLNTLNPTSDIITLYEKGIQMKMKSDLNGAIENLNMCLIQLKETDNKELEFKIYNDLSHIYHFMNKEKESVEMAELAKLIAQNNFGLYSDHTYNTNVLLSSLYNKQNKYDKCLVYDLENLQITEHHLGRNCLKYAQACNDVGLSYLMNENLEEAESYFNITVNLIKEIKDEKCKEMIIPNFNWSLFAGIFYIFLMKSSPSQTLEHYNN